MNGMSAYTSHQHKEGSTVRDSNPRSIMQEILSLSPLTTWCNCGNVYHPCWDDQPDRPLGAPAARIAVQLIDIVRCLSWERYRPLYLTVMQTMAVLSCFGKRIENKTHTGYVQWALWAYMTLIIQVTLLEDRRKPCSPSNGIASSRSHVYSHFGNVIYHMTL